MPYREPMHDDQIALQLYTVRRLAADDLAGTLAAVAAAGYRVRRARRAARDGPAELARLLDDAGLSAIASHEGSRRCGATGRPSPTGWPRSAARA